jgi:hypothetical protein
MQSSKESRHSIHLLQVSAVMNEMFKLDWHSKKSSYGSQYLKPSSDKNVGEDVPARGTEKAWRQRLERLRSKCSWKDGVGRCWQILPAYLKGMNSTVKSDLLLRILFAKDLHGPWIETEDVSGSSKVQDLQRQTGNSHTHTFSSLLSSYSTSTCRGLALCPLPHPLNTLNEVESK